MGDKVFKQTISILGLKKSVVCDFKFVCDKKWLNCLTFKRPLMGFSFSPACVGLEG